MDVTSSCHALLPESIVAAAGQIELREPSHDALVCGEGGLARAQLWIQLSECRPAEGGGMFESWDCLEQLASSLWEGVGLCCVVSLNSCLLYLWI